MLARARDMMAAVVPEVVDHDSTLGAELAPLFGRLLRFLVDSLALRGTRFSGMSSLHAVDAEEGGTPSVRTQKNMGSLGDLQLWGCDTMAKTAVEFFWTSLPGVTVRARHHCSIAQVLRDEQPQLSPTAHSLDYTLVVGIRRSLECGFEQSRVDQAICS
jgi:hypothetical protein